jgi:hypothetical protein
MLCYALTRGEIEFEEEAEWAIPTHEDSKSKKLQTLIPRVKQYIAGCLDGLTPGGSHHVPYLGYHFYVRKSLTEYFGIITDEELSGEQCFCLYEYILQDRIDIETIAQNLQPYTINPDREATKAKLKKAQETVNDTRDVMKSNIFKMHLRGDRLKELEAKTAELQETAEIFHHEAKEFNSRCPSLCGWIPWLFGF